MSPTRAAGLLYLVLAIAAAFGTFYVPLALVVPGDAAATAEHIRTSESLFRLGIASELISATMFIFVVLALYRLFKGVDQARATMMVVLVLASVPITFLAVVCAWGALTLLGGADYLSVLGKPQLEALALFFLRLRTQAIIVDEIFWGLWLFPLALLVIRSGFAPRVVGVLLILAGGSYLAVSFTSVLLPQYASVVSLVALVPQAGELSIIIWLLTTRARVPSLARGAIAAAS